MQKTTDKRQQPTDNRQQMAENDPKPAAEPGPTHRWPSAASRCTALLRAGLPLFKLDTFPLFLGNAGYLYLISTAVLPCAQSMAEPHRFGAALNPSIVVVRPGPRLRRDRPTSAPGPAHICAGTGPHLR
jgi:hypothetical protein